MMVVMKIGQMMVVITMMIVAMNNDCDSDEVDGSNIKDDLHDNIAENGGSQVDATLFLVLLHCNLNQTCKLFFTGNC